MSDADACPSHLLENPESRFEITQNVSKFRDDIILPGFHTGGQSHLIPPVLGHTSEIVPTSVSLSSLQLLVIILSYSVTALYPG